MATNQDSRGKLIVDNDHTSGNNKVGRRTLRQSGLWIFFASELYILAMIVLFQAYNRTDMACGLGLIWSLPHSVGT